MIQWSLEVAGPTLFHDIWTSPEVIHLDVMLYMHSSLPLRNLEGLPQERVIYVRRAKAEIACAASGFSLFTKALAAQRTFDLGPIRSAT